MTVVTVTHEESYTRYSATTPEGYLYEAWSYRDGGRSKFAIDCTQVPSLPTDRTGNAVVTKWLNGNVHNWHDKKVS